jgi:MFS family permease
MYSQQHLVTLSISLFFFFCGFNFLEACLPSLVSKAAPANSKGSAMGVYSCAQFLGIFCGGTMGGWLYGHFHINSVFICNASLALVWLKIASGMRMTTQVVVPVPATSFRA